MDFVVPFDQLGQPSPGPWTNASPQAGQKGSIVNANVFPAVQNEILNVQDEAGLTRDSTNNAQLLQAIRSGKLTAFQDTGTADALVITPRTSFPSLGFGLELAIQKGSTPNATTTPKVSVGGLTATLVKESGAPLSPGDLPGSCLFVVRSDGTNLRVIGLRKSDTAAVSYYGDDSGTADALSATMTPAAVVLAEGTVVRVKKGNAANGTTTPTLQITNMAGGGSETFSLLKSTGTALAAGDLPANGELEFVFDGAQLRHVGIARSDVLNLITSNSGIFRGALAGTANATTTTLTPAVASMSAIPDGSVVVLTPSLANTGNVTVNGAPLYYVDGASNVLPGELQPNQPIVTVKLGSSLLLRSPPNPQRTAVLSSTATNMSVPANQYTPANFVAASSAFASISGNTITILQPGNYNLTAQLNLQIAVSTGPGNYALNLQVRRNGATAPIFGGEQDVGDYGTGSQGANPSVSPTTQLLAGDTLQVLAYLSSTYFSSGAIAGGNFSLLKVS